MMTIYRWENGGLRETSDFAPSCWINLVEPTTTELERVLTHSGVPRDFLTDPLDTDERPRFDYEDDASILIVHVPYAVEDDEVVPYRTVPLGIILVRETVITVCSAQTPVTTAFLDQIRRVCPPSDRYRFAFRLLWHGGVLFLRYLHDIHQRSLALEDELHESISNEVLLKLLTIEKSLVYFSTSLKGLESTAARIGNGRVLDLYEEDHELLDDVNIEIRQALEMCTIYSNILNGITDTFSSVISNNLNITMRTLTIITLIMAIPTIIFSFYGMNVEGLPLIEWCWFPVVVAAVFCLIAALFLRSGRFLK